MATASNKTTTRRVTAPAPAATDPAPRTQPPVSVLAEREKLGETVRAQARGWAAAAQARIGQDAAAPAPAATTFNDGVTVQRGVLEPEELSAAPDEELSDEEIEAILAEALARKRANLKRAQYEEKAPVKASDIENKFVANRDFGYGDEFRPHGLSRGQVFSLRGLRNDARLVEMGYMRPLAKYDTLYECNVDGTVFTDITLRDQHVERCYSNRNDKQQDQYEEERQTFLAEVAPIKIPTAQEPVRI